MDPFQGINQHGLECIEKHKSSSFKKRAQFVYRQGDSPHGIYFLRDGLVGLLATTASGKQYLLRLFKPGQSLGHRAFFANETYHASAVCLEDCQVEFVARTCISQLLEFQPELYKSVILTLARELRIAEQNRISLFEKDVLARTSEAIIYFNKIDPTHRWTRRELADLISSTPPTVVRTLQKLEKLQLIESDGKEIKILNYEGLMQLAEGSA